MWLTCCGTILYTISGRTKEPSQSQDELQQLREDLSRLRRNLAQQLTETGDIVSAIRQIDEDFYAGKYFSVEDDDEDDDFFADIRRTRVLLGSLGGDLKRHKESLEQGISKATARLRKIFSGRWLG